ncbi:polysaccharide deacetylase family protein [Agriterribacter sp.]|uniref:polysaccharide deacetylase family protein n=1 Tax=Agriterribacter sp. TaxID=2821509 RepID=UPI002CABE3B0|nr:polysaccharide deacetylase family protein [Agriterribacter sp.]HRO44291.1 polysaccharide deacetylase family protein [Agriterribacter sp.]HRQ18239.1 polysaccharide deacetylase family protein [Agriterribacter sp.]
MQTKRISSLLYFCIVLLTCSNISSAQEPAFTWPTGKKMAISLSFDDARASQVDTGTALLDAYNVKATFYVQPPTVKNRLDGWKKAVTAGHEIGNHSISHPCSGNFLWSRNNALEDYSLRQMKNQLETANRQIEALLGVKPEVFAYPCGQTFVGRGKNTKSYIPVVAGIFISGRGWLAESANDPAFCDMAQLTGIEMDGKDFEELLPLIQSAQKNGQWLVLAGHEMGNNGPQTTRLAMLKKLIEYAQDPTNKIWIAPVGTIARYVNEHRKIAE